MVSRQDDLLQEFEEFEADLPFYCYVVNHLIKITIQSPSRAQGAPGRGGKGVGEPPPPSLLWSHHALRFGGYKTLRGPGTSLLALSSCCLDLCQLREQKMVKTRRPLGSLASAVNVGGEDVLRTRVPRERTHVERQAERM